MRVLLHFACAALTVSATSLAIAEDADMEAGKKLYEKECMTCHGFNVSGKADEYQWTRQELAAALAVHPGATQIDVNDPQQLAVAPPFGPNLGGVYGRAAGTVEGFHYSEPFLKTLKGMIWDEGSLNTWLTSTQRWVPGVTMYYSQKDAEVRRKIIQYLKANP